MSNWKKFFTALLAKLALKPKTREELLTAIRSAEKEQVLDRESEGMIEGVLQVSQMHVRDIMVPRSQMVILNTKQDLTQILSVVTNAQHSRYPVMDENQDEVDGILLAKDLLRFTTPETQANFSLRRIMQPVMVVPESQHLDKLLKAFKIRHNHMAIAVDEFGHIAGLITMEDVLEQIVGDIEDESDLDEDDGIKKFHDHFVVKADLPLDEFDEYFNVKLDQPDCESIGGWLIKQLGHIPKRNDEHTFAKLTFKVLHADERRVRLIHIKLI
jgi:magnesium and cobalt transporter